MFKVFYLTLILTLYYAHPKELQNVPGSDFCFSSGKPKLEITFVIDQSSYYIQKKFYVFREIVDFIYKEWPGSKVGLTTFADYSCVFWLKPEQCPVPSQEERFPNGTVENHHMHPEGCYIFQNALSSDPKPIVDRINIQNIEFLASGGQESGLMAVYRTVADPEMKWTRGRNVDEDLLRMIFVTSDSATWDYALQGILPLEDLKGDGTDKCLKNKNPIDTKVAELLAKDDMAIYMLYANTSQFRGAEAFESWNRNFRTFREFNIFTRINELNSTDYINEFKSFVNDFKRSKVTPCADPPAYNTLGL